MTNAELDALFAKYSQRVSVCCDTEHAHSAVNDCLAPLQSAGSDERDVIICKLCEVLLQDRRHALDLLTKIMGGDLPKTLGSRHG